MDRFSRHLEKGIPAKAAVSYLQMVKMWLPSESVIYINDGDVVKSDEFKFEALGIIRDGSDSTYTKNVYDKGYLVTEAYALTSGNRPVSLFSRIHSSSEKTINLPISLPLMPGNKARHSLARQHLRRTVVTMPIKYSSNWMN